MDQASRTLVEAGVGEDPYGHPAADLLPSQLAAADAVVAERRAQVPILDRRARDAGLDRVGSKSDLVPLLLPHTAYKSYPASFVAKERWTDLARWLSALSTADLTEVDFEGVLDEDEWVDRLRDAGHFVLATSGTTGKCSFLPHSDADHDRKVAAFGRLLGWPFTRPDGDRGYFWLGPHRGVNSMVDAANIGAELWSTPDRTLFLTDERLRLTDVSRMAAMRRRMTDGTATPGEIREFEQEQAARSARLTEGVDAFIDRLLERRHEPLVIAGAWAQHLMVRERARELGVPDGDFHPGTIVSAGGGVKNVAMPDDYKERVASFYGDVLRTGAYGMTELFGLMNRCENLRYHVPPPVLPLVLDRAGETLLNTEDVTGEIVVGRFAFVDFAVTGRWSGMITSDRVEFDTSPVCACGRPGPTILDTITRFQTDDDSIGCAGTIDGYLRGALAR
jgi:hypothetical protein